MTSALSVPNCAVKSEHSIPGCAVTSGRSMASCPVTSGHSAPSCVVKSKRSARSCAVKSGHSIPGSAVKSARLARSCMVTSVLCVWTTESCSPECQELRGFLNFAQNRARRWAPLSRRPGPVRRTIAMTPRRMRTTLSRAVNLADSDLLPAQAATASGLGAPAILPTTAPTETHHTISRSVQAQASV